MQALKNHFHFRDRVTDEPLKFPATGNFREEDNKYFLSMDERTIIVSIFY